MTLVFLRAGADVSELPTEFPIFYHGENASTKGSVWFDEQAAVLVMAAAELHNVDYIIDLNHYSVKPRLVDPESTDGDARGYFRPEMRGKDLWAANVTWTPDGAERLRSRRQRYTSPAFMVRWDPELDEGRGGDRVVELRNVALCSEPATHSNMPLVASQSTDLDASTDPVYAAERMTDRETLAAANEALAAGDTAGAQAMLTAQLATEPEPPKDETKPPAPAPAPGAPPAEDTPPEPEELSAAELSELRSAMTVLRGISPAELRSMAAEFRSLTTERTAANDAERRALIVELIALECETPATAWSNDAPVPRLASEALSDLRSRVAVLRSTRPAASNATPAAPSPVDSLTPVERAQHDKLAENLRPAYIAQRTARKVKAQTR